MENTKKTVFKEEFSIIIKSFNSKGFIVQFLTYNFQYTYNFKDRYLILYCFDKS